MIILHSKNSTLLRVPKTGSTSFEASIRFVPTLVSDGDYTTGLDDANLLERGAPQSLTNKRRENHDLIESIRSKRDLEEPNFTQEEQDHIDFTDNRRSNDSFELIGLGHSTLEDLTNSNSWGGAGLLTEEQILNYNHYAFIRNPLKRAISSFLFRRFSQRNPKEIIEVSDFHETILKGRNEQGLAGLVFRQQIDYFKYKGNVIVTPLLFENYSQSMDWVIQQLGGTPLNEYPKFKDVGVSRLRIAGDPATVENWIDPYPEIKQAIINRYSEDVTLWQNTSGETL